MILMVCTDPKNGMIFHNRRQSKDRMVLQDMIQECKQKPLYCSEHTAKLFEPFASHIIICHHFCTLPPDAIAFAECPQQIPPKSQIQMLIRYQWNRHYPSDQRLPFDLSDWHFVSQTHFVGSSHKEITKEIYIP